MNFIGETKTCQVLKTWQVFIIDIIAAHIGSQGSDEADQAHLGGELCLIHRSKLTTQSLADQ